jgi:hypothetical protein
LSEPLRLSELTRTKRKTKRRTQTKKQPISQKEKTNAPAGASAHFFGLPYREFFSFPEAVNITLGEHFCLKSGRRRRPCFNHSWFIGYAKYFRGSNNHPTALIYRTELETRQFCKEVS